MHERRSHRLLTSLGHRYHHPAELGTIDGRIRRHARAGADQDRADIRAARLLECRRDAQGWLYGTVRPVPGLPSLYRLYCRLPVDVSCFDIPVAGISWSAHPILFVINLAILLPADRSRAAARVDALGMESRATEFEPPRFQACHRHGNPRANGALSRVASRSVEIAACARDLARQGSRDRARAR